MVDHTSSKEASCAAFSLGADCPKADATSNSAEMNRRQVKRDTEHMAGLTWDQIDNIALELYEAHPETDPLTVRFTDLHQWVRELPGFSDDPAKSNEKILEAIQMMWLEEAD